MCPGGSTDAQHKGGLNAGWCRAFGLAAHTVGALGPQDLASEGNSLAQLMTAGRWTNPAMPARYTRNQAAARNAVALYYRQLSMFDKPPGGDKTPLGQRLFTDEASSAETTSDTPNILFGQEGAG